MEHISYPTADRLWEAAVGRFPRFTPDDQRVGLVLLGELARGGPVTASTLAGALDVNEPTAKQYLTESPLSPYIYHDDEGAAAGFFGLSTTPTDHRFSVNGQKLWTWCAADTLFLPELLDATATVESKDPVSGENVSLIVSPAAVESAEPEGLLVSLSSPETWETTSARRIIMTACHYIHFFVSSESGRRWTEENPNTVVIPLEDAFVYVHRQNMRLFGHELARRASA